jgi:hypothetical protein
MMWRVLRVTVAVVQVLFGGYLTFASSNAVLVRGGYVWIVIGGVILLVEFVAVLYQQPRNGARPPPVEPVPEAAVTESTPITEVQRLVDSMLDVAQATQPGVAHSITLTPANSLLLPQHSESLRLAAAGQQTYGRHVYRGCEVWDEALLDHQVIVQPVVGTVPEAANGVAYFGDLRNGTFGTEPVH